MSIITREEAKAAGLTRFFTGRRCRRGHIAERQVSNGNCIESERLAPRQRHDPEHDPRCRHEKHIHKTYKMAAGQFDAMMAAQKERCGLCGGDPGT